MNMFSLSLRNLRRRPARTAALLVGLAALSGLFFTLASVYLAVNGSIKKSRARLGADAIMVPEGWRQDAGDLLLSGGTGGGRMDASVEKTVRGIEAVEAATSQLYIVSTPLACCSVSDVLLVGFEPGEDFVITPWLRENLKGPLGEGEVIVGHNILSEPGGRIRFYGEAFLITGKLEPTGMKFMDSAVFMPMADARRMVASSAGQAERPLDIGPAEISAVMLTFGKGADPEEAAIRMEYALPGHRVLLAKDALRSARRSLLVPVKTLAAAWGVHWVVSLMLIGVLYGIVVEGRRKETGLMRAMGASPRHVRSMFLYEVLVLSTSGGLTGVAGGWLFLSGLREVLTSFLHLPFVLPPVLTTAALAAGTVLFTLVSGVMATVYPMRKAAAEQPHEAVAG